MVDVVNAVELGIYFVFYNSTDRLRDIKTRTLQGVGFVSLAFPLLALAAAAGEVAIRFFGMVYPGFLAALPAFDFEDPCESVLFLDASIA